MYNPIIQKYASRSSSASIIRLREDGSFDRALPNDVMCQVLWAYYLNNGLYDELRLLGIYTGEMRLKSIRNPAKQVVEFYASTIWPGSLDSLRINAQSKAVEVAIRQIWNWSNWRAKKEPLVREAAVTGDVYIRIAQPENGERRVFLQTIKPQYVTEKETDERDYITYARIDIPQHDEDHPLSDGRGILWHTEEWTRERVTIWQHGKGREADTADLGGPVFVADLAEWGIDFVPLVQAQHINVGESFGLGAYTTDLDGIDEVNLLAHRLHAMLFRYNDVTWAVESNMLGPDGRPLPAPRINLGGDTNATSDGTVEMGGEKMIRLPGHSKLTSMVPSINYDAQIAALAAHIEFKKGNLPELSFYSLRELPEMSGKALRIMMLPAISRGMEVRGNHEDALIRAHKIALTIGKNVGAFNDIADIGTYEAGDYEHGFAARNLIPLSRAEVAELAQAETAAGIPLEVSMRESGRSEAWIRAMLEAEEEAKGRDRESLASSLMRASQGGFGNGTVEAQIAADESK